MLKHFIGAGLVAAGTLMFAPEARAVTTPTVNTTSNVVFLVDESGSMGGEQTFLQSVVTDLDSALMAAGVTDRSYGVLGFGGPNSGNPRTFGTAPVLQNAVETATNLASLITSGGTEDGYEAIAAALSAFNFDAGAAVNFILVTDEDRDDTSTDTYSSILSSLTNRNILLNAILNASFEDGLGATALGIDDGGDAYLADGSGGFTTSTGAVATGGFGTTVADYVDLALATGGAAWDLNQLRSGGSIAESFTQSFLSIKVQEITTQPPSGQIPLPAGGWLLLTGLGGLAALRRKRRAA